MTKCTAWAIAFCKNACWIAMSTTAYDALLRDAGCANEDSLTLRYRRRTGCSNGQTF
ncbi:hypothetical protein [Nostoc sp.]|uniref:hypothetical protein n=1 Tax=Nostoc sp. TaxID=1180 RepID=UPI002FF8A196